MLKGTKTLLATLTICAGWLTAAPSQEQLSRWLQRFPEADANRDGRLTPEEARAYRDRVRPRADQGAGARNPGAPRTFAVDPGWESDRFPEHAVCYRSPAEIRAVYAATLEPGQKPVVSFDKPGDGALRLVGTGHSFMAPGYRTLPLICRAAGFDQPLYTHTGGGITGSSRYKWEEENGIFEFDGKPRPKLLASIANAEWDAMIWGPYFNDKPAYYTCWIEFCLRYNPDMLFFLSDAWPQLDQLEELPDSEQDLSAQDFLRMGEEKNAIYGQVVDILNRSYPGRVFIMPTSDAMVLAAQRYFKGELPGVKGINEFLGGEPHSLWQDRLGHLGPGFDRLEGYVFYATLYGRSPESIREEIGFRDAHQEYPSDELDRVFRRIAWEAVTGNPRSGVRDRNQEGIDDDQR